MQKSQSNQITSWTAGQIPWTTSDLQLVGFFLFSPPVPWVANTWDLTCFKMLPSLEDSTTVMQRDLHRHTYSIATLTNIYCFCSDQQTLFMFEFHLPKQSSSGLLSYITIFFILVGFRLIFLVATISQLNKVSQKVLGQVSTMLLELLLVLSSYRICRIYSLIKWLKCWHFKNSMEKGAYNY